jgi:hypothetical protein
LVVREAGEGWAVLRRLFSLACFLGCSFFEADADEGVDEDEDEDEGEDKAADQEDRLRLLLPGAGAPAMDLRDCLPIATGVWSLWAIVRVGGRLSVGAAK